MHHNKSLLEELTNPNGSYAKFMFTSKNLRQFTKHTINFPDDTSKQTNQRKDTNQRKEPKDSNQRKDIKDTIYKPCKKDSLFWCFFILKYGFSKYEMEVGNQHFTIEKQEKFKYIDEIRKTINKDLLKMHKIKPLSLLEDDLANQERISIKTFFALCIIEKINIMLIDKRKVYEIITTDDPKIHVIHRNSVSYEHYIELHVKSDAINTYRESYYKMSNFDAGLKSMTSYKLEELLDLCKKLNIVLEESDKKKLLKKDIYELLVQQY